MVPNNLTAENSQSAARQSGGTWIWLSRLIIVAGVGWVLYVFSRDFSELRSEFEIASIFWLVYSLAAGATALLLTVPIFRQLIRFYGDIPLSYVYAARLLFVAQMLRHLPGRVWGIVYLVKETNLSVSPVAMIRANLDIMLYSMTFNLLISAMLVIGVMISWVASIAFTVISLAIVMVAIRLDWIGTVIRTLIRLIPRVAAKYEEALTPREPMPWSVAVAITSYYVLVWCLYISIWWSFTRIFPVLADTNIWLLCASYSVAWVAGYVSMITPGGLGIREAGFIALSTNLASLSNLTFLAVFVRLWQILVEFVLFLAFAFVRPDTENANIAKTNDARDVTLN